VAELGGCIVIAALAIDQRRDRLSERMGGDPGEGVASRFSPLPTHVVRIAKSAG
jgi:hypothetical protein